MRRAVLNHHWVKLELTEIWWRKWRSFRISLCLPTGLASPSWMGSFSCLKPLHTLEHKQWKWMDDRPRWVTHSDLFSYKIEEKNYFEITTRLCSAFLTFICMYFWILWITPGYVLKHSTLKTICGTWGDKYKTKYKGEEYKTKYN